MEATECRAETAAAEAIQPARTAAEDAAGTEAAEAGAETAGTEELPPV